MSEEEKTNGMHQVRKKMHSKKKKYIPNHVSFRRLLKIVKEFRAGFKLVKKYDLAVTFFGSSRTSFDKSIYETATSLAAMLARDGFAVFTGGGNGIMEAANKGAYEAGGQSIGLNIKLPFEQQLNKYTTDKLEFEHFFTRKVVMSFASEAYVYFPGGFGTLDELFEIITLIQTGKIQPIPVILVNKEYWTPLLLWIDEVLNKKNHAINPEDMKIYHLVDTAEEAHELIIRLVKDLVDEGKYSLGETLKRKQKTPEY